MKLHSRQNRNDLVQARRYETGVATAYVTLIRVSKLGNRRLILYLVLLMKKLGRCIVKSTSTQISMVEVLLVPIR